MTPYHDSALMQKYTIYHNPHCSKSRATLHLLRDRGIEPSVVLYLDHPLTSNELRALINLLHIKPRDLLRTSESEYKMLNLDDPSLNDEAVLQAMVMHPKLIERPIVATDTRAVIGRPPENVLELIDD